MSSVSWITRLWVFTLTASLMLISCMTQKDQGLSIKETLLPKSHTVTSSGTEPFTPTRVTAQATYGKLPLQFEANQGQSNEQVQFLAHGHGYTLFLTPTEAVLALRNADLTPLRSTSNEHPSSGNSETMLRMQLVDANTQPQITGEDTLPGKSNYFFGHDPTRWHTDIPTYAKVRYRDVYPGVDLVYYGNQQQLEYDFVIAPGADPTSIRLAFDGLGNAGFTPIPTIDDATGDLLVNTPGGQLCFHQPRIYQEIDGHMQPIAGRYVLFDFEMPDARRRTQHVGFEVAAYDTSKPLIIDPVFVYSTYFGGSGQDWVYVIAVDATGNVYMAGRAAWNNSPTTTSAFQTEHCFGCNSSLAKLDPSGSKLLYSTYLLGFGAPVIDIDRVGNAYVADTLLSYASGRICYGGIAPIPVPCPTSTAVLTKVNEAGSALVYTILLGGSVGGESPSDIAVDTAGNAYVTGPTSSLDFPVTDGAFQSTFAGLTDAFIAKIADRPAGIKADFESPENGLVSGLTVIRGWAFATEPGVSISSVELFIDGQSAGAVPCRSQRGDVQAAFPQFPADNTLNSGWGLTFNWGVASAGLHTLRLFIRGTAGELLVTDTRTVTIVKPGDFEYLDQFDLSQATASIENAEVILNSVIVRDKASQQQKRINTRFRWQPSSQSFGLTQAETVTVLSSWRSPFSALIASLPTLTLDWPLVGSAQATPGLTASFDSPVDGQAVAGVGLLRGWAVAESGVASPALGLMIDGQWGSRLPCCSARADVAAAFADQPTALSSGWGAVFNYGLLSPGYHTIQITADRYDGWTTVVATHEVLVVRPGGFEYLDQFDLSGATARIERDNIILSGVVVRDKANQQTKTIKVWLRWFENTQGLGIVAANN